MSVVHFYAIWNHVIYKICAASFTIFMSRIHPAIRKKVSVHGLAYPLKLHQCYWYLLEANTLVYHILLQPLAHHQPWWCPLFLLRSYLPQETIVMSLMYDCSCSVEHDMYKILTATRISIVIIAPALWMLRIHPGSREEVSIYDLNFCETMMPMTAAWQQTLWYILDPCCHKLQDVNDPRFHHESGWLHWWLHLSMETTLIQCNLLSQVNKMMSSWSMHSSFAINYPVYYQQTWYLC